MLSQAGKQDWDDMLGILLEQNTESLNITTPLNEVRKYFPVLLLLKGMKEPIFKLLDHRVTVSGVLCVKFHI